jgi:hypothetical protein
MYDVYFPQRRRIVNLFLALRGQIRLFIRNAKFSVNVEEQPPGGALDAPQLWWQWRH